jgi:hypothetical protein
MNTSDSNQLSVFWLDFSGINKDLNLPESYVIGLTTPAQTNFRYRLEANIFPV